MSVLAPHAPIVTVWSHKDLDEAQPRFSGMSGGCPVAETIRQLATEGHAILTDSRRHRPTNHHIIGYGVSHDDASFAETGGRTSMAVYYENGAAFGGAWWETTSATTRRYYFGEQA